MAGLAVTTSALSLPRLAEQGWGIIVTSHFLSDVTVQGHKRGSFPQLPWWGKAAKQSLVHPLCMETSECLPIPIPQPIQDLAL